MVMETSGGAKKKATSELLQAVKDLKAQVKAAAPPPLTPGSILASTAPPTDRPLPGTASNLGLGPRAGGVTTERSPLGGLEQPTMQAPKNLMDVVSPRPTTIGPESATPFQNRGQSTIKPRTDPSDIPGFSPYALPNFPGQTRESVLPQPAGGWQGALAGLAESNIPYPLNKPMISFLDPNRPLPTEPRAQTEEEMKRMLFDFAWMAGPTGVGGNIMGPYMQQLQRGMNAGMTEAEAVIASRLWNAHRTNQPLDPNDLDAMIRGGWLSPDVRRVAPMATALTTNLSPSGSAISPPNPFAITGPGATTSPQQMLVPAPPPTIPVAPRVAPPVPSVIAPTIPPAIAPVGPSQAMTSAVPPVVPPTAVAPVAVNPIAPGSAAPSGPVVTSPPASTVLAPQEQTVVEALTGVPKKVGRRGTVQPMTAEQALARLDARALLGPPPKTPAEAFAMDTLRNSLRARGSVATPTASPSVPPIGFPTGPTSNLPKTGDILPPGMGPTGSPIRPGWRTAIDVDANGNIIGGTPPGNAPPYIPPSVEFPGGAPPLDTGANWRSRFQPSDVRTPGNNWRTALATAGLLGAGAGILGTGMGGQAVPDFVRTGAADIDAMYDLARRGGGINLPWSPEVQRLGELNYNADTRMRTAEALTGAGRRQWEREGALAGLLKEFSPTNTTGFPMVRPGYGGVSVVPAISEPPTPNVGRRGSIGDESLGPEDKNVARGSLGGDGVEAAKIGAPVSEAEVAASTNTASGGGGTGNYQPGSDYYMPAPGMGTDFTADWSEDDAKAITRATVGREMGKAELNNWIDAFYAEHKQWPWDLGPFDGYNNLIDHLMALGESQRVAAQGSYGSTTDATGNAYQDRGVTPEFWVDAYYNRYNAPTYPVGWREQPWGMDRRQDLLPGQYPGRFDPYWQAQMNMGNYDEAYANLRRPWVNYQPAADLSGNSRGSVLDLINTLVPPGVTTNTNPVYQNYGPGTLPGYI